MCNCGMCRKTERKHTCELCGESLCNNGNYDGLCIDCHTVTKPIEDLFKGIRDFILN